MIVLAPVMYAVVKLIGVLISVGVFLFFLMIVIIGLER